MNKTMSHVFNIETAMQFFHIDIYTWSYNGENGLEFYR